MYYPGDDVGFFLCTCPCLGKCVHFRIICGESYSLEAPHNLGFFYSSSLWNRMKNEHMSLNTASISTVISPLLAPSYYWSAIGGLGSTLHLPTYSIRTTHHRTIMEQGHWAVGDSKHIWLFSLALMLEDKSLMKKESTQHTERHPTSSPRFLSTFKKRTVPYCFGKFSIQFPAYPVYTTYKQSRKE